MIEVLDVNEPPIQIVVTDENASQSFNESNPRIEENSKTGSIVGTINGFDGDYSNTLSFSLDDDSNGTFTISSSVRCQNVTQQNVKVICKTTIHLAKQINYEDQSEHNIIARVTDQSGLHRVQKFKVMIVDVNDEPTNILINGKHLLVLNEGEYKSQIIGHFSTIDEDKSQLFTYKFIEAEMSKYFEVQGDQLLTLDGVIFDFESKNLFTMTVGSTDKSMNPKSIDKVITIQINDINERPTSINLDNLSFQENCNKGTIVGNLSVTDPDNAFYQKQNHSCSISKSSLSVLDIVNNQLIVNVHTVDYEQVKPLFLFILSDILMLQNIQFLIEFDYLCETKTSFLLRQVTPLHLKNLIE